MYILVKNDSPDKLVPVITAHASLACYVKFQENENMILLIIGAALLIVSILHIAKILRVPASVRYANIIKEKN